MRHLHSSRSLVYVALLATFCAPSGALAQEIITETIPGTEVSFTLVAAPGGAFVMGSPDGESGRGEDEGPQHEVTVAPFFIGMHEVTYEEYTIFRYRDRDSDAAALETEFDPDIVARPSPPYEDPAHGMGNHGFPAVGMTQWGALQYARWLTEKTGHFYRLPTEAEWEYACRAATSTAYSFGGEADLLDAYAWHLGNSDEIYHRVGEKAPNPWGLRDMHGNVAEWTLDQYDATFYADRGAEPWAKPTSLHPRTVRGGAYDDAPDALRCAARLESNLSWKRRDPQVPRSLWWNTDSPFVGFRLVRPRTAPTSEEMDEFWALVLGG